jgi:hypothetical protein
MDFYSIFTKNMTEKDKIFTLIVVLVSLLMGAPAEPPRSLLSAFPVGPLLVLSYFDDGLGIDEVVVFYSL